MSQQAAAPREHPPEAERTAVYRLYDEDEELLYVGVAIEPRVRFRQHRLDKPWWPRVAAREIEWFDSRAEALAVEGLAIVRELPRHNQAGAQWPHHQVGEAPGRLLTTTDFKYDPQRWMDHVAATREPVVITRFRVPLVVIVPFFGEPSKDLDGEESGSHGA